ncbi:hypothetical protein CIG19_18465 [Enterobacterales bacterium CwR94]|nr:hypothetical protein CIG19_18465 [Enterobacterales bacterium CwR94]
MMFIAQCAAGKAGLRKSQKKKSPHGGAVWANEVVLGTTCRFLMLVMSTRIIREIKQLEP